MRAISHHINIAWSEQYALLTLHMDMAVDEKIVTGSEKNLLFSTEMIDGSTDAALANTHIMS